MSFVYTAVAIAERRVGKLGASIFAGRPGAIAERNLRTLKSSSGIMFIAGFVEPVLILIAFGYGVGGMVGNITDANGAAGDAWSVRRIIDADGQLVAEMLQHVHHPGQYDQQADKTAHRIVAAVNGFSE